MKRWLDKWNQWLTTIWPTEIVTAIIAILLLLPPSQIPEDSLLKWIPQLDKAIHFFLFGGYAFILERYISSRLPSFSFQLRASLIFCWIGIYGIVMECLQGLTGRDFSWMDWVADMSGALLCLSWIHYQRRENNQH
ncbi:MAG: VanZ family protein [Bacteroidetes bacterium]|nr:VanZ family protein [Bacteroidota bacterium]